MTMHGMTKIQTGYFVCVAFMAGCAAQIGEPEQQSEDDASPAGLVESALENGLGIDITDYEDMPGGFMKHRSCTHEVPDGSKVSRLGDGAVDVELPSGEHRLLPRCAYPVIRNRGRGPRRPEQDPLPAVNGWVEHSQATAASNGGRNWFNALSGQWTVPQNPVTNGALLYFFNSLTSFDANPVQVIQPVLRFGGTEGNIWKIAAYWVDALGNSVHTTWKTVNSGDKISGSMLGYNCTTGGVCFWVIGISTPTQSSSMIIAQAAHKFTVADQAVLEARNVTSCNHYPRNGQVTFSNTLVYQPPSSGGQNQYVESFDSLTWHPVVEPNLSPNCGYTVLNLIHGAALQF
jgi:hypothetical protein